MGLEFKEPREFKKFLLSVCICSSEDGAVLRHIFYNISRIDRWARAGSVGVITVPCQGTDPGSNPGRRILFLVIGCFKCQRAIRGTSR